MEDIKKLIRNNLVSKYDPIIDEFLVMDQGLARVKVKGKEGNYIRTQLQKRINSRGLEEELDVSVVNGECYLEKKG